METVKEIVASIKEIDERMRGRWSDAEDREDFRGLDEANADDRERLHELTMELLELLDLDVIAEALGDARAYRIGDGSDEPGDREAAGRYERAADRFGLEVSW